MVPCHGGFHRNCNGRAVQPPMLFNRVYGCVFTRLVIFLWSGGIAAEKRYSERGLFKFLASVAVVVAVFS